MASPHNAHKKLAKQGHRAWTPRQAAWLLSLFILGGLLFAGIGTWHSWQMTRELATARKTEGVVQSATVRQETSTDAEGRTTSHHVPEIAYTYAVNGAPFRSDRIYPGGLLIRGPLEQNPRYAKQLVDYYAPGKKITVWYLPREPGVAFLERSRRVANGLFIVGGGILAAAGIGLWLPFVVSTPKRRWLWAVAIFLLAQALSFLVWSAFLAPPREELDMSPQLLQWLLVAYIVVCLIAMIAHAPPPLHSIREATISSALFATLFMSLSLFVLVPLQLFAPHWQPLSALPWIGLGTALLTLVLWTFGCVTVSTADSSKTEETSE